MRKDIHPEYNEATITCTCGHVIKTKTTRPERTSISVCSACHPFYTGKQKFVDAAGRVEKFMKKYSIDNKKA